MIVSKRIIFLILFFFLVIIYTFWKVGGYRLEQENIVVLKESAEDTEIIKIEKFSNLWKSTIESSPNPTLFFSSTNKDSDEIIKDDWGFGVENKDIEEYARELLFALEPLAQDRPNELNIFKEMLATRNFDLINEIKISRQIFEKITERLKDINPPIDNEEKHHQLILSANEIAYLLYNMEWGNMELMKGMDGAWNYPRALSSFYYNLIDINSYFKDKDLNLPREQRINININL